MKLFLSYGHDHNAVLVERIRKDLLAAGHEVWIDTAHIKAGDDWRRSIFDGLADTDWVLGFLSKHSIRDPGVCLDELSIALHTKSGAIATILLEGEAAADPPVTVSHIQWLDMHDWQERLQTPEGEAWYQQRLRDILAFLRDPAVQRFSGEIKALESRLMPVSQVADIGALIDQFVGRAWLRDMVEQWRNTAKESRLLWISGGAGTGKSAFAAWLGHQGRVNVIGLNLCSYNKDDRRDAGRVIRTLAFQMASRLPDYRRLVLERLQSQNAGGDALASKGAATLFTFLIVEPLRLAIDGGRSAHRYLIVIDGLDETVIDGRSELAEVLAAETGKLPPWLAVLVTSRPEEPILRQFAGLQPFTIKAEAEENEEDLRIYARGWLGAGGRTGAALDLLIERMVTAAAGNFLYLRMLREAVSAGTMSLDAPEGLPKGLAGLYERWFRHRFPNDAAYERYVPLLEVVVAASHPIPLPWLTRLFGWSKREAPRLLEGLGSLFEQRAEGLAPFHKSLRDWLTDVRAAGPAYVVDETAGMARLVDALWPEFTRWAAVPAARRGGLDEFCAAELPHQVMRLAPAEARTRLGTEAGWPAHKLGLVAAAEAQEQAYAWPRALSWWRLTAWLAQGLGAEAVREFCYAESRSGDIFRITGRVTEALAAYGRAAEAASRLAADALDAELQRQSSVYLTKQGDAFLLLGDLPAALDCFSKGLRIRTLLAEAEPDNGAWRDDIASAQRKIGDVLQRQGQSDAARRRYQEAYAIANELVRAAPGRADWQLSRYLCGSKIGQMLLDRNELTEAEPYLGGALEAVRRICEAAPGDGARRHDLWVSTTKMGEWAAASGDTAQAGTLLHQALDIMASLATSDPGNLAWQNDLATAHDRLGTLLAGQGLLEGSLAELRAGLVIAIRTAKLDPANASWRFDLAVSYDRVGTALMRLGRPEDALSRLRDALSLLQELADTAADTVAIQHALAKLQERVGGLLARQGDKRAAREHFLAGLGLMELLTAADPARLEWRRDCAIAKQRFSNFVLAEGDALEALGQIRDALKIGLALVQEDPGDARFQLDLAAYKESHARLLFGQAETRQALGEMVEAHEITEWVAQCDPANDGWQHKLAISHANLGAAFGMAGERRRIREHLEAGRAIMAELLRRQPGQVSWQQDLRSFEAQISAL